MFAARRGGRETGLVLKGGQHQGRGFQAEALLLDMAGDGQQQAFGPDAKAAGVDELRWSARIRGGRRQQGDGLLRRRVTGTGLTWGDAVIDGRGAGGAGREK